ncbi:MAG TPA: haloacid dehalogenase type II [Casimicrobiaceae bacterium]|nr:haloacid dehalogenase type II [Casimicrobiaceae bacterium]
MALPPRAFVFDAYGTLFDVHSVVTLAEELAPRQGAVLSQLWRTKQLEYTWLQSLMLSPAYARDDFAALTARALDYAVAQLVIPLSATDRQRLLDAYRVLDPFPDAVDALAQLAPRPRWILSNGTLAMLRPLVEASPLAMHIDAVLSVDDAGIYKPAPRVYQLAVDALDLAPAQIAFVSSNGWDAAGAKAFGFTTFWINRYGLPVERHAPEPDYVVGTLGHIAAIAAGLEQRP